MAGNGRHWQSSQRHLGYTTIGTGVSACRVYYLSVKNAEKDVERLSDEVLALKNILESINDLARGPTVTRFLALTILITSGPADLCEKELSALKSRQLDWGLRARRTIKINDSFNQPSLTK